MKKILLFSLLVFISHLSSYAQVSSILDKWLQDNDKNVPQSPNAASLGMYGAVPVGHYSGTPNINIPIYQINLDGKIIPIGLSYHASGFKVGQDAGWVGLGWSLNAGGCITRQVNGLDDFDQSRGGYYYIKEDFSGRGDEISLPPVDGTPDAVIFQDYEKGLKDGEPDLFSFNFADKSGSFFFAKNGVRGNTTTKATAEFINRNTFVKIIYNPNSKAWVATDGEGFLYYFASAEITTPLSVASRYYYADLEQETKVTYNRRLQGQIDMESAWMLDSIVSPNNKKLKFVYDFETVRTSPSVSEESSYLIAYDQSNGGNGMNLPTRERRFMYSRADIKQAKLKEIIFDGGNITFETSKRLDMRGEASKLDAIQVKNTKGGLIKSVKLAYNYSGDTRDPNLCRLVLESVQEYNDIRSFRFTYNKGTLPAKTSVKQDIWGYYSNTIVPNLDKILTLENACFTLIPSYWLSAHHGYLPYPVLVGTTKYPDEANMKAQVLEKIEYPTGGYTQFEYEGHRIDKQSLENGNKVPGLTKLVVDQRGSAVLLPPDLVASGISQLEGEEFILNDGGIIEVMVNRKRFDPNRNGGISTNICLEKKNTTGEWTGFKCEYVDGLFRQQETEENRSFTYILEKGTYRLCIKPNESDINKYHYILTANCYLIQDIPFDLSQMGFGGLRVKKIMDIPNKGLPVIKEYKYEKDGVSSGLLYVTPSFYWEESRQSIHTEQIGSQGSIVQLYEAGVYLVGRSFPNSSYRLPGSSGNVGYSYVEEIIQGAGKNTYTFHNKRDLVFGTREYLNGYPTFSYEFNGSPHSIVQYDNDNNPLNSTSYGYTTKYYNKVRGMKYYVSRNQSSPFELAGAFIKFYDMQSLNNYTVKETRTDYQADNQIITSTKEYVYNPYNDLANNIKITDSRNRIIEQEIKYPTDYPTEPYLSMTDRSMISLPIEEVLKNDNKEVSRSIIDYFQDPAQTNNLILPYQLKSSNTGVNGLKTNLTFDRYNAQGNLLQQTDKSGIPTSFLWGYSGQYVIAKIQNATYDQVKSALGSTPPESLSSALEPDMDVVNSLRKNLPGSLVTTYTYYPLIGMKTATDAKGLTTYYEYDNFGRLSNTRVDDLGTKNLLESYQYNYAGNGNTIPGDIPPTDSIPVNPNPEPTLTPDPYKKGKASSVLINIGAKGDGSYGLTGWNYDTQKVELNNVITKTYKTIEAGEYIWTTENLRLKYGTYGSINMNWVNLTQADVDKYANEYLNGQKIPLEEFEQVFGTWVTLYDVAMMYRNIYWGVPNSDGTFDHTWGLPTKEDIWQLYGQAPRTSGNVYEDIKDFLFASACDNKFGWTQNMFNRRNISGLTLTPLGMRESNQGGVIYGFGQVASLQTATWAGIETLSDRDLSGQGGIISNPYSYHFTQARHRRPLTDQELGYKMYIDAASDQILMLPYNQASSLPELAKGLERGIALRYANREHLKVLKKWSEIQAEAIEIKSKLAPTNYPAPPALLPCEKEPEPEITADPYTKGKESTILINIGAKGDGSYGLTGWNYDTKKVELSNVITKTYKTIEASEYIWTTENLRLKYGVYGSVNMNWVNLTQTDVDKYSADYLSGKSVPLDEFEQVYGTWSTLYDVAMMYRNIYWGVPTGVNTFDHTWGLPAKEDIWQLYGQAPRTTDNFYNDIKDFLFASSSDFNFGWTQGLFKNKNTSGLTLTPLGMRESNQAGAIYGFGQVTSLQTSTWAAIETLSDRDLSGKSGLISNPYSYHFTQARHRRPLTDQELGYKMYIDAANDQVLMLPYDQVSTLPELPKGLERGVALRYANRKAMKVVKKWSEIQAEASEIKSLITK